MLFTNQWVAFATTSRKAGSRKTRY